MVHYLGQVYGGEKPFDENFSDRHRAPTTFSIGTGAVIKGWDQALVGRHGRQRGWCSAIPPELGYGDEGSPSSRHQGHRTLYFVVDILGAA